MLFRSFVERTVAVSALGRLDAGGAALFTVAVGDQVHNSTQKLGKLLEQDRPSYAEIQKLRKSANDWAKITGHQVPPHVTELLRQYDEFARSAVHGDTFGKYRKKKAKKLLGFQPAYDFRRGHAHTRALLTKTKQALFARYRAARGNSRIPTHEKGAPLHVAAGAGAAGRFALPQRSGGRRAHDNR